MEWLESRTLLAGLGFEDALAQVSPAVASGASFTLGFSERIGRSELFVTGTGGGAMTIDFDRLPSFVTAVHISNFDSVTFSGRDSLNKLVASNIRMLDADQISIGFGLYANNVRTVTLASGGSIAVLNGPSTLLEVDDLGGTLIISDLQHLAIASKSAEISIVSLNSAQNIRLFYPAERISVAGLTDPFSQVFFLPASATASTEAMAGRAPAQGVVTISPDERTINLISQVRNALRPGDGQNLPMIADLLGQLEAGLAGPRFVDSASAEALSDRRAQAAAGQLGAANDGPLSAESVPPLGALEIRPDEQLEFSGDLVQFPINPAPNLPTSDVLEDITAQEASGHINLGSVEGGTDESLVSPESTELFLNALSVENHTLKDVVLTGVIGEISPGERSAFLLVDPKPPRAGTERNRESSLQEIAQVR